ncbi:DNA polymerase III subunit epsilon [Tianweitania sediminis]|uniref:DNA polymerase III subunit epsilon n=1 Tax=Tianweitania sediminis TaxID=1502156 RepID=A0A8J7UFN5_9HYPH|nr:DNA polymerase III subunit epsilon [Tianweitania sediminis]MBP0437299.1 DNA polymerase III subunit epsilon [Tianweitania sediminis]
MSHSRIRVVDLETGGNGRQDVCEVGWQDVVLGADGLWRLSGERGAILVNPGRPIAPDTMAVHHIRDADVADAPFWREVAPDVLRPEGGCLALAAHRAGFEQRYCTPRFTGDVPWICTWKCALRVWPHLPRFSNQMLRYLRSPEGLVHEVGLPAHRAMPDAYVTAHHLRDLLNEASLEQLIAWSREPGLLPRVPAGLDRGKSWERLTLDALLAFAQDRDVDVRFTAATELARRSEAPAPVEDRPVQGSLL